MSPYLRYPGEGITYNLKCCRCGTIKSAYSECDLMCDDCGHAMCKWCKEKKREKGKE